MLVLATLRASAQRMLTPLCRHSSSVSRKYADLGGDSRTTLGVYKPDGTGPYPVKVNVRNTWKPSDIQVLAEQAQKAKNEFGIVDWQRVAAQFTNRTSQACKFKHAEVVRNAARIGGAQRGSGTKQLSAMLRIQNGVYNLLSVPRAGWTAEDDKLLLSLRDVPNSSWDDTSRAIGKYSPTQCRGRFYLLRGRKAKLPPPARDSRVTKPECRPTSGHFTNPRHDWTQNDCDKLRSLLAEHGRYSYKEFSKHFPGHSSATVYNAVWAVLSNQAAATGPWTPTEHRALLGLVNKHVFDWRAISQNMPTDRSPAQCRAHYVNICISPIITRSKWTTDEIERLKLLVRLFKQGRLTANKDEQLARGPLTQTALAGFEEFSTADISRFASALNQDDQESQETKDATSGRQPRNRFNVDWQLISLYMGNRTWKQCYYMWMTLHNKRPGFSCYEGPWSREEDMLLYTLYQQAPNKWSWIASRLPRKRDRQVVRARYISYVGTYVDMLRQCRGAEWDPLADQFEEVHMRCEVLAWYRRQSLGYRPQDPYKCPLDLCMTGL